MPDKHIREEEMVVVTGDFTQPVEPFVELMGRRERWRATERLIAWHFRDKPNLAGIVRSVCKSLPCNQSRKPEDRRLPWLRELAIFFASVNEFMAFYGIPDLTDEMVREVRDAWMSNQKMQELHARRPIASAEFRQERHDLDCHLGKQIMDGPVVDGLTRAFYFIYVSVVRERDAFTIRNKRVSDPNRRTA